MTDTTPFSPRIVLAVGAHADDIDFGASGTIARFAAAGAEVHYLIITDGSKGAADPATTSQELIATRRQEQRAAAAVLGVKEVHFLNYEDGLLELSMALKKDIVRLIRRLRPDTVIAMDPTMVYSVELGFINHPDHRAAGQATLDAVYPLARDHLSFPDLWQAEQLAPHKVAHLLLINLEQQNYYVDITTTLDTKIAALEKHASQVPDVGRLTEMLRVRAAAIGRKTGSAYAEGFVRLDPPA